MNTVPVAAIQAMLPAPFNRSTRLLVGGRVFLSDIFAGKFHSCLGVDIQSAGSAPSGEGVGININLLNNTPLTSELLQALFSSLEPFVEGAG